MDPYWNDWLDLAFRWLHVIAGIVWIGTSFYFVALDNHLRPPRRRVDADEGVGGESWEIHGGGFYRVQKFRVAPETIPEPLHWYKWEAYATWVSGFALMVVVYYFHADLYLVDREVADLSETSAIAISVALLAVAWLVYDGLCRLLHRRQLVLAGALVVAVSGAAYGMSHLYSGRGMYLQVGAMLGTIMAANVLFVIIPGHWDLVRAKEQGREPDAGPGIRGKERSIHNNYLTLPVVFAMISNHFPFTHGHEHGWAILVALMLIGAWIRHFFNLRHQGRTVWLIPASAAAAAVALAFAIEPEERSAAGNGAASVSFFQVEKIVSTRCATCHSASPTSETFRTPPKGVVFDTPAQIQAQARAIEKQAVLSRAMPLGNVTEMTDKERELLGIWIRQGAKTE